MYASTPIMAIVATTSPTVGYTTLPIEPA